MDNIEVNNDSRSWSFTQMLEAAEAGKVEAYLPVGNMYLDGKTDDGLCNLAKAEYWYEKARSAGYDIDQEVIDQLVKVSDCLSIDDLLRSGRDYYFMGKLYKALNCLELCIKKGNNNIATYFNLGQICRDLAEIQPFESFKQKYVDSCIDWYYRAAQQNYSPAETALGCVYNDDKLISHDYTKAFYWLERAAAHGDMIGIYNLGLLYEKGNGVRQDYDMARQLYLQSAEMGYMSAKINYGSLTYKSDDEKLRQRAYRYFYEAAESGDNIAQYNLGLMYYYNCVPGENPDPDRKKCINWMLIAARNGNEQAFKALAKIRRELKEDSWSGILKKAAVRIVSQGLGDFVGDETSESLQEWIDGDLGEVLSEGIGDFASDTISDIIQREGENFLFGDYDAKNERLEKPVNDEKETSNEDVVKSLLDKILGKPEAPAVGKDSNPKVVNEWINVSCDGGKWITFKVDFEAINSFAKSIVVKLEIYGETATYRHNETFFILDDGGAQTSFVHKLNVKDLKLRNNEPTWSNLSVSFSYLDGNTEKAIKKIFKRIEFLFRNRLFGSNELTAKIHL